MLKTKEETIVKEGVGVIIGRFQVSNLHQGHIDLIQSVIERHEKVIIVLGIAPVKATKNNPLDFETRKNMIEKDFPNVKVLYQKDNPSDKVWSEKLDELIVDNIPPFSKAILYGSRSSFAKFYSGRFEVKELIQEHTISGTEDRTKHSYYVDDSENFRKGVIWATQNQYDRVFPTVDIAILSDNNYNEQTKILLGRKPNEDKFRLIGGFVDPTIVEGNVFEKNAKREVMEETGLEISDLDYVGNYFINDWRYRSEKSKIVTTLFIGIYTFGIPEAKDDIAEVKWFDLSQFKDKSILNDLVIDIHHVLINEIFNYFNKFRKGDFELWKS